MGSSPFVLVCDSQKLFAESLGLFLRSQGWDVTVVHDPANAALCASSERVDACVMDLEFPGATGVDGIQSILTVSPTTKVVVLTEASDPALLLRAAEVGAATFVFKDDDIERVVDAVRRVLDDERTAVARPASHSDTPRSPKGVAVGNGQFLTAREHEALRCLARGESSKQLARSMGVSPSTGRTHVQNLLRKLEAHTRLEALALAFAEGLVSPFADPDAASGRDRGAASRRAGLPNTPTRG
jgi:two-component system nitrate/nitrite response regulator NarL